MTKHSINLKCSAHYNYVNKSHLCIEKSEIKLKNFETEISHPTVLTPGLIFMLGTPAELRSGGFKNWHPGPMPNWSYHSGSSEFWCIRSSQTDLILLAVCLIQYLQTKSKYEKQGWPRP